VLKSMGETPTDAEIDEMIFMADLDGASSRAWRLSALADPSRR
jgi:Ca2+-binding EF-hand superfamily protein